MPVENRRANIERLMSSGAGSNTTAVCDRCGSTYFYSVNVEQLAKGFGSVEYTTQTTNPKPVRICICGMPLPSNATARGARAIASMQEEFTSSLNAARKYIESNAIKELIKEAASPKELAETRMLFLDELNKLSEEIEKLKVKEVTKEPKVKT